MFSHLLVYLAEWNQRLVCGWFSDRLDSSGCRVSARWWNVWSGRLSCEEADERLEEETHCSEHTHQHENPQEDSVNYHGNVLPIVLHLRKKEEENRKEEVIRSELLWKQWECRGVTHPPSYCIRTGVKERQRGKEGGRISISNTEFLTEGHKSYIYIHKAHLYVLIYSNKDISCLWQHGEVTCLEVS